MTNRGGGTMAGWLWWWCCVIFCLYILNYLLMVILLLYNIVGVNTYVFIFIFSLLLFWDLMFKQVTYVII